MHKLIFFFKKHFVLLLFFLVLLSYGQILFMQPWQEDNVIFFKIAHIEESTGFMGPGLLGEGPYRHTAIPYYLIYKIFGYNIPIYYSVMLLSYFFATVAIYLFTRELLNEKAGRVASFLYGCGYIASEGFLRVYTSTNISSGIAFTALTFWSYLKYFQKRKIQWYFLTVFLYLATIQVSYVRVHYLIIPLLFFDFLFLVYPKLSRIKNFIFRSIPFLLIFYEFYIIQGDTRRSGVVEVFKNVIAGNLKYLSSFVGSLGNLVFPDFMQKTPIGFGILVLAICLILVVKSAGKFRKIYLFLFSVVFSNIAAYAIYTPFVIYGTNYRYLAHSAMALAIIFSVFSLSKRKIGYLAVLLFGFLLLFVNVKSQHQILIDRTARIVSFYNSLKKFMPQIPKDAVIYFDVQDSESAKKTFAVSFSVAEMPETTAIAWRWGLDRYDFKIFTDYNDAEKEILARKIPEDKIFSFWLSSDGLMDTSGELRKVGRPPSGQIKCDFDLNQRVICSKPISSVLPVKINFELLAKPKSVSDLVFPVGSQKIDVNLSEALEYQFQKNEILNKAKFSASSNWKERIIGNINDGNPDTVWQSDRILWGKEDTFILINLPKVTEVSRLIWSPGHSNNIPSEIKIEVSLDGGKWVSVNTKLVNYGSLIVAEIDPIKALGVKLKVLATSGMDSPQIADIWVLDKNLAAIDIVKTEEFLKNPFSYIENAAFYNLLLKNFNYLGKIKISWLSDKSVKAISSFNSVLPVLYDGKARTYSLKLPPGGTHINEFIFNSLTIPGEISVKNFRVFQ